MIIRILTALLLPFALGLFVLAAVFRHKLALFFYWERLSLAFLAGTWLLTFLIFCLSWLGIPLEFQNIIQGSLLLILCLAPFAVSSLNLFVPEKFGHKSSLVFYVLIGLIGLKFALVLSSALIKPMISPDIIALYARIVKDIFMFKVPQFPGLKPPFPFLIESWPVISLGQWNDTLLPLFYPFMLLSLLVIFYSSLRRYFKQLPSVFFTFLLVSLPFLLFHAGTAYTDFPLAVFYPIATFYLFQFFKEFSADRKKSFFFLMISLIFLGMCVWIKKSGIYYAGINMLVLAGFLALKRLDLKRADWRQIAQAFCLFSLTCAPWLAYQRLSTISYYQSQVIGHVQSSAAAPVSGAAITGIIIAATMLRNMFMEGNWQLLWALFTTVLIFYPRKAWQLPHSSLTIIISLNLAALFVIFGLSNWSVYLYDDSIINRLMLHSAPIVLYFCAEMILSVNRHK